MIRNINKLYSLQLGRIFLLVLFVMSILPFLWITFYVHPSADDDFMNCAYADYFGRWETYKFWYLNWQGRYFSTFLYQISPWCYESLWGYRIIGAAMVVGLVIAMMYLVHVTKSFRWQESILLGLGFTSVYLYQLPSVPHLYWLVGAFTFQLPLILGLVLLAHLIVHFRLPKHRLSQALIIFLVILICGTNEFMTLITTGFIGFWMSYNYLTTRRVNQFSILVFSVCILATLVVFLAPGTFNRATYYSGNQNLIFSLQITIITLLKQIKIWLTDAPILPITLLYVPFIFFKIKKDESLKKLFQTHPIWTVFLWGGVLALPAFIYAYGRADGYTPRIYNVIYFFFLMGWFYHVISIPLFLRLNWHRIILPTYVAVIVGLMLFFAYIQDSNVRYAYTDILSGDATTYDSALLARYNKIKACQTDTCWVDTLPVYPRSIFYRDILADHLGEHYGRYFGKKHVKIPNYGFYVDSIGVGARMYY